MEMAGQHVCCCHTVMTGAGKKDELVLLYMPFQFWPCPYIFVCICALPPSIFWCAFVLPCAVLDCLLYCESQMSRFYFCTQSMTRKGLLTCSVLTICIVQCSYYSIIDSHGWFFCASQFTLQMHIILFSHTCSIVIRS